MATATKIDKYQDVIDSRDVIARIEELREEIESADIPANEIGGPNDTMADEREELVQLEKLAEQGADYAPDWQYGEALIRDSYFKNYAMDLAEDIGAIPKNAVWPNNCIDWEQAARELRMDYTAIEFDDVTYWIR